LSFADSFKKPEQLKFILLLLSLTPWQGKRDAN